LRHGIRLGEERIFEKFFLDELARLQVGVLQKLDGLTQLRGHHQRLRLSQVEPGSKSHDLIV
jgi:hypothetical protein